MCLAAERTSSVILFNVPRRGAAFPWQGARINKEHLLASGLLFFAVSAPSGYIDLVSGLPLIGPFGVTSSVKAPILVPTPLGMAWQFPKVANGTGVYFKSQPNAAFTPPTNVGMTIAAGITNVAGFLGSPSTNNYIAEVMNGATPNYNTGLMAVSLLATAEAGGAVASETSGGSLAWANNAININLVIGNHVLAGSCANGQGGATNILSTADNGATASSGNTYGAGFFEFLNLDTVFIGAPGTGIACGRAVNWVGYWQPMLSAALLTRLTTPPGPPTGLLTRRD